MDSQKYAPSLIEDIQLRIKLGRHSVYEGLALHCWRFYLQADEALHQYRGEGRHRLQGAVEGLQTVAAIIEQYDFATRTDLTKNQFGALCFFGLVQTISHAVEAVTVLCDELKVGGDKIENMKGKEYWKFRTRSTHINTRKSVRSLDGWDQFDYHLFAFKNIRIDAARYYSQNHQGNGRASRPIFAERLVQELFGDLYGIFPVVLDEIRKRATG